MPAAELDLTSRTRQLVAKLGVKDTDELGRVTEERVRAACDGRCGALWNEITRVLEALGYDVSKRKDGAYWW